jgi:hypothetical protein
MWQTFDEKARNEKARTRKATSVVIQKQLNARKNKGKKKNTGNNEKWSAKIVRIKVKRSKACESKKPIRNCTHRTGIADRATPREPESNENILKDDPKKLDIIDDRREICGLRDAIEKRI